MIRKATSQDSVESTVGLGVSQTRYVVLEAAASQESLQGIIDGVGNAGFCFPREASTSTVINFCRSVAAIADVLLDRSLH